MDGLWQAADDLLFGGQPTADDLKEMAQKGVKTIINLRLPQEESDLPPEEERRAVEALGMKYVNLPMQVGEMNADIMGKVHELLEDSKQDGKVLVH